jgi:hypothetical protein
MTDEEKPDPKTSLLTTLLSNGDQTVKFITLALVVVSGGGNFFATKQAARISEHEAEQALRQVSDIHKELTASLQRQKEIYEMVEKLS